MRVKVTCLGIDCPERTGGKCWAELNTTTMEVVRELRVVRKIYDDLESSDLRDTMEPGDPKFVTWRGWKMIRNVITDRIEELTGSRV